MFVVSSLVSLFCFVVGLLACLLACLALPCLALPCLASLPCLLACWFARLFACLFLCLRSCLFGLFACLLVCCFLCFVCVLVWLVWLVCLFVGFVFCVVFSLSRLPPAPRRSFVSASPHQWNASRRAMACYRSLTSRSFAGGGGSGWRLAWPSFLADPSNKQKAFPVEKPAKGFSFS